MVLSWEGEMQVFLEGGRAELCHSDLETWTSWLESLQEVWDVVWLPWNRG